MELMNPNKENLNPTRHTIRWSSHRPPSVKRSQKLGPIPYLRNNTRLYNFYCLASRLVEVRHEQS